MTVKNDITWHIALPASKDLLYPWLIDAGSFMERLEQYGVNDAYVDILRQDWLQPEAWECELLGMKKNERAYIREVCIFSHTNIWLYGRTVFPQAMLDDKQELSHLKNRPLGSVLFQDPAITRSQLEFSYIKPAKLWQDFLPEQMNSSWVRRSLFCLNGNALLLTEILMPDLEKLCLKN